ncbi:MAG TPA: pilus assembly PilX N-terminal domain-containing protein [Syntrophomonadaceae bacterium]|nr:pilus assembly PilX N-terminal domain-containing protein [Syntrophomonadaceae bacterium]
MIIRNEKGNLMLMALMIFLIISIMGTSLLAVAEMENKISFNDRNAKKALLAADSGLEIARNIIIKKLIDENELSFADIKSALEGTFTIEEPNLKASIKVKDSTDFNTTGEIELSSTGKYGRTEKTIVATFKFNNMPSEAIRTDKLKVAGRYNEKIDEGLTFKDEDGAWIIKTYHKPWGQVEITGAPVAYNTIVTNENNSDYFNTSLADIEIDEMLPHALPPDRPPHILNSNDFLNASSVNTNISTPNFTTKDVGHFYKLAEADPKYWSIWDENTFDFSQVDKPFNFIKGNSTDKLKLKIHNNFWANMKKWLGPYWQEGSDSKIVIVSEAELNVELNGEGIDLSDGYLYLLSSNNINFDFMYELQNGEIERNAQHKLKTYALSGANLNLNIFIDHLYIDGSLLASKDLTIDISDLGIDWGKINDAYTSVYINGEDNKSLIENFPFRWSFLGVGKTVEYEQKQVK